MSTTTLTEALDFIASDATEADIDRIYAFAKTRLRTLRDLRAAEVAVGQTVTIKDITPKALVGLTGVVTAISNGRGKARATVLLDEASTTRLRFSGSRYNVNANVTEHPLNGVPLSCCEPQDIA